MGKYFTNLSQTFYGQILPESGVWNGNKNKIPGNHSVM